MKTEEGKLKDKIKADLKRRDCYYFMPVQTGYGKQTVDFLVCLRGTFIAIETKAPGKKPTPRQWATLQEINNAGGGAFWCDNFENYLLNMRRNGHF